MSIGTKPHHRLRFRETRLTSFPIGVLLILFIGFPLKTVSQNGRFEGKHHWSFDTASSVKLVGDFNGDGVSDVAWHLASMKSLHDCWLVALGNGRGKDSLDESTRWCDGQAVNDGVWAGDFNGDGMCDKITYVSGGYPDWNGFWVSLSGRDPFAHPPSVPGYRFLGESRWTSESLDGGGRTNAHPESVIIGDFNGDGIDDVAFSATEGNTVCWFVLVSRGRSLNKDGFERAAVWLADPPHWASDNLLLGGDFNGDGKCDIAMRTSAGDWYVAVSNGVSFDRPTEWATEPNSFGETAIAGDFNGDGRGDIAFHVGSQNSAWYVMTSAATSFNPAARWAEGDSVEAGTWAGDFDGDGLCDKITYVNATGSSRQGFWVTKSNNVNPREVGVWHWTNNDWRYTDPQKIPVVGWGSDNYVGRYVDQADSGILRRQFEAMRKCGIDFVVEDLTNGVGNAATGLPDPPYAPARVDTTCFTQTRRVFDWARNARSEGPKLSVGLGMEFWGRNTFYQYGQTPNRGSPAVLWADQRLRQTHAVSWIYENWANNNPTYYAYLHKPLLIVTFGNFFDYPWRDTAFQITSRNTFPKFTVRYGAEWNATYARWAQQIPPASGEIYAEGADTKRLWNWGAGAVDGDQRRLLPLPRSSELMSIMPGTTYWWRQGDSIARRGGDYYMNSWKQVLATMPRKVLICNWNNWMEETSIEGCVGKNGWKDRQNKPAYDWYLKITRAYTFIFKHDRLPDSTYVREEGSSQLYFFSGRRGNVLCLYSTVDTLRHTGEYPGQEPDILLPKNWLSSHLYTLENCDGR